MVAIAFNGAGSPLVVFLVLGGARVVTPSLASILVNFNVLVIALLVWILGRKKFSAIQLVALATGFAGIVWISLERGSLGGEAEGVAYLLIGSVLIATVTVAIERPVVDLGAVAVTRWSFWIGFIVSFIAMIITGQVKFHSLEQSGLAIITGGLSLGAPVLLFNLGMSKLGSADAAAFKLLIPFFALTYGFLILGQIPNLSSAIAGVLVIVSVAVYQLSGRGNASGIGSARPPGF
jgi:drug/metabolite transporter (DMT)-like permease